MGVVQTQRKCSQMENVNVGSSKEQCKGNYFGQQSHREKHLAVGLRSLPGQQTHSAQTGSLEDSLRWRRCRDTHINARTRQ